MRGDDLVPLILGAAAPTGGSGVGFRQGVVQQWNQATAENVIDVGGAAMTNLPILNTSEAAMLAAGDVVGILTAGPSWWILGRLTIPGTPAAASALSAVSSGIAAGIVSTQETTTSTTYGDLATVGPSATVTIRPTGKALVIITCQLGFVTVGNQEHGQSVSFVASGANTLATSPERSINFWLSVGSAPSLGRVDQMGGTFYLDGLNPGQTTFTLKFRSQDGLASDFSDRVIVVWPL